MGFSIDSMAVSLQLTVPLLLALFAPSASGAVLAPSASGAGFPFPYNWSKFPTAWFASNATNWESNEQIELIGKYSMAILGWQHLDTPLNWTAVVYTQLTQTPPFAKAISSLARVTTERSTKNLGCIKIS